MATRKTPPDLELELDLELPHVHFEGEARWYAGTYDTTRLVDELAQLPSLEPFEDELGNRQSAFRLELDRVDPTPTENEDGEISFVLEREPLEGVWVVAKKDVVDWAAVKRIVDAHDPEPPAPGPTIDEKLAEATTWDEARAILVEHFAET